MNNPFFSEIHGRFGFGCMRLPMKGDDIDIEQVKTMADAFLDAGFNYFDTAHGYHAGKSELALREAVAKRYDRSRFLITNKLTAPYFEKEADIRPFFAQQLEDCGVDYFDFYLMHAQDRSNFPKFQKCRAYETAFALKEEGKIRHVGLSFHDTADVLDEILTAYPQVEIVQIQYNYLDYDNPAVQSRKCYEVCAKHGKPMIAMEPVKGGSLVKLPDKAQKALDDLQEKAQEKKSNASYAVRFVASEPEMAMVISGMSDLAQMQDNLRTMQAFTPLSDEERGALQEVVDAFHALSLIPCTSCHYCTDGCPAQIRIPEMFTSLNLKKQFHDWTQDSFYTDVLTVDHGKASACVQCGQCEAICPQHLKIIDLLRDVAKEFERAA